jgi:hypothetical protein
LDVPADSFLVVRAGSKESIAKFYGRYGVVALAFTNPIFLDADGDGHTPWSAP